MAGPPTKPRVVAAFIAAVCLVRSSRLARFMATTVRQTVEVVLAAPMSARETTTIHTPRRSQRVEHLAGREKQDERNEGRLGADRADDAADDRRGQRFGQ